MQNKSNAVTKEGERLDSRATTEQFRKGGVANVQSSVKKFANRAPANDASFDSDSANGMGFNESGEATSPHKPSNIRFINRTNERGVAGDVKRRTADKRIRGAKAKSGSLSGVKNSGARGIARVGAKFVPPQAKAALAVAKNARKVKGLLGWGLIAPVATAYFFQLVFAIISLAGFGIYVAIQDILNNNVVFRFIAKVAGWFTNLDDFIPGDNLGFIFWALATIVAFGVFIVCTVLFYLRGSDPFQTTMSFLIASFCLAGSMLPILNLLPLLLLWVIYVNVRSTASLFSS